MDWIERLTGVELDGGTGALEWVILLVPVVAAVLIYKKWKQVARAKRGR